MEQKIIEIFNRKREFHDNQETFFRHSAYEISCQVMDFILWKDNFTHFDIEQQLYMVEVETHVIEIMDFDAVYLYWFENKKE